MSGDSRTYVVTCTDCPRSEEKPFLPLQFRENCGECASRTADRHRDSFPGHRVEVIGGEPDRSSVVQLRKRQG